MLEDPGSAYIPLLSLTQEEILGQRGDFQILHK
jgi:hypothetical protein